MKNTLVILLALFISASSFGQFVGTDYSRNYSDLLNRKKPKEPVDGSPYLFDTWMDGVVVFNDDEGGKYDQIKVDLMESQLEVMYMNQEKILPFRDFKMLKLNSINLNEKSFFQVGSDFAYNGKILNGMAKVTPIGEHYKVVELYQIRVIPPNINNKIVGAANYRKKIVQEKKLFIQKRGKLLRIKNKKQVYKILTSRQKKLKAYVAENNLNLKKEQDLVQAVEFYQTLIVKKTK